METSDKRNSEGPRKKQLVIFVDSGVSNNSGIPTWWDLIKVIADELGYKCNSCKNRQEDCPKSDCEERYDFSQDDNPIDDEIFKILPHHIIVRG